MKALRSGVLAALLLSTAAAAQPRGSGYEVWAVDQNLNVLYVLDADGKVLRTVDVPGRKLFNVVKLGDRQLADFHGVFIPAAQR